ncbi:hypothetical protein C7476_1181, partial [Phyllobacterium bourgognense]
MWVARYRGRRDRNVAVSIWAPCNPPNSLMVSLSNHAQQHCHPANHQPSRHPINLQTKIIVATYPRSPNLSYPMPVLSMGSCFRSRSKVGKDG